jgi:hypothetical protein
MQKSLKMKILILLIGLFGSSLLESISVSFGVGSPYYRSYYRYGYPYYRRYGYPYYRRYYGYPYWYYPRYRYSYPRRYYRYYYPRTRKVYVRDSDQRKYKELEQELEETKEELQELREELQQA